MVFHAECYYCSTNIDSDSKVGKMECHGNEDWVRLTCPVCTLSFLISEKDYDAINLEDVPEKIGDF